MLLRRVVYPKGWYKKEHFLIRYVFLVFDLVFMEEPLNNIEWLAVGNHFFIGRNCSCENIRWKGRKDFEVYDPRSYWRQLSSSEKGLDAGLEPRPLRCRCRVPPVQLSWRSGLETRPALNFSVLARYYLSSAKNCGDHTLFKWMNFMY